MSSLATAYICEEEAAEDLAELFGKINKVTPVRMKVLEFMRRAFSSPKRIHHDVLLISGLSDLLTSKYVDANPLMLFRESLRNLSRDTTLLIQVRNLKWSPTDRGHVDVDGVPFHVSDLDIETTTKLQEEHLGTGKGRKKRKDNFIIAHL